MLDALCQGTTDRAVLSDLAKGRLRKKIPALQEALDGRYSLEHAPVVSAILAYIDFLDEQIERLSDIIEEQLAPFAAAVRLLRSGDQSAEIEVAKPRALVERSTTLHGDRAGRSQRLTSENEGKPLPRKRTEIRPLALPPSYKPALLTSRQPQEPTLCFAVGDRHMSRSR